MGAVRVGDALFDQHGKVCAVLSVSEVQHGRDCYEVAFSDDSVIVADAAHSWLTFTDADIACDKIRTTQEISVDYQGRCKVAHFVDTRYITGVNRVASVPVKCVQVDSPSHLYLAGPTMIPTHNSDLLLGLASTAHRRSIVFRRDFPQLRGLIDRSREIIGDRGRLNENAHIWRNLPGGRQIEFGGVNMENDKQKYRGRPHDLKGFDEITEFTRSQYRFLIAWARTTTPGQRVRVVCTGNPPSSEAGLWVIEYWAPWLDETHPNPAQPGELRWFATLDGEDRAVESGAPFEHNGETITPRSRTFIPARVQDNPYLMETDYMAQLQNLPEPLRSQLLKGQFKAELDVNPWQVIPTEWIKAAQERWKAREKPDIPMTAMGIDVARGGQDKTVIACRFDTWFAPLIKYPGAVTDTGPKAAALVAQAQGKHKPEINVDVIGVGSSVVDHLPGSHPINFAAGVVFRDKTGRLKMRNVRAAAYWSLREALDPDSGADLALPDDRELLADLAAPTYSVTTAGVLVEPKEDIIERLGRSPDCGDALVLAHWIERRGKFYSAVV